LFKARQSRIAIFTREMNVKENEVGLFLRRGRKTLLSVRRENDVIGILQDFAEKVAHGRLVIDDEHGALSGRRAEKWIGQSGIEISRCAQDGEKGLLDCPPFDNLAGEALQLGFDAAGCVGNADSAQLDGHACQGVRNASGPVALPDGEGALHFVDCIGVVIAKSQDETPDGFRFGLCASKKQREVERITAGKRAGFRGRGERRLVG
jgi:hypothetical protein